MFTLQDALAVFFGVAVTGLFCMAASRAGRMRP